MSHETTQDPPRRIGLFGGTFDPIHLAHLVLAERAREEAGLDVMVFIPAAIPPHKREMRLSPGPQRLAMVELAIAGHPSFQASAVEIERAGVSYTVDTLRHFRAAYPHAELFLLLGSDSLELLPSWYQPEEIVRMARLLVARRPPLPAKEAWELASAEGNHPYRYPFTYVESPLLAIASRDLRDRVRQGRSIRYLVPAAVEAYIHQQGLYREP